MLAFGDRCHPFWVFISICVNIENMKVKVFKKKRKNLAFFHPFFFSISRLSIFLYCLEKFSGRNNANISQASSVTVDA